MALPIMGECLKRVRHRLRTKVWLIMAESSSKFFALVSSFLKKTELKNDTTSVKVIKCLSEALL